jgi:type IV pilus assembly protein PilW
MNSTRATHFYSVEILSAKHQGQSLIELLISVAIGLLTVAALITLFVNTSRTNLEMVRMNSQIENGRFAIQLLENNIAHSGFWGSIGLSMVTKPFFPVATAIPDPCDETTWNENLLSIPVQGFAHNTASLTACGITSTSALANSDIVVVHHANQCTRGTAGCEGGTDTGPHIQVSTCQNISPSESPYVIDVIGATYTPADFPLRQKDCTTLAPLRKIQSNIYYIALSEGTPHLMRSSMFNGEYLIQPLINGIESFRVEYGIDNLGRNGLAISASNPPDGSADAYVACAPCTLEQLRNVVAIRIYVLARTSTPTPSYSDTKTYILGGNQVCSTAGSCTNKVLDPAFKRHVFSTTIRLVNVSSRRETP